MKSFGNAMQLVAAYTILTRRGGYKALFTVTLAFAMCFFVGVTSANEGTNAVLCAYCSDSGVIRTWKKCPSPQCKGKGSFVEYKLVNGKREVNVVECMWCNNAYNPVKKIGFIIESEKPCTYCNAYAKRKSEFARKNVVFSRKISRGTDIPVIDGSAESPVSNDVQPETSLQTDARPQTDARQGKCPTCSGRGYCLETCSKCGGSGSIHVLTNRGRGYNIDHKGKHKTRLSNCPRCRGGGGNVRGKEKKTCPTCNGTGRK